MTNAKRKYRELCSSERSIPIFSQDWWLDIVCEGANHWDVVIVEKGSNVVAAMPYFLTKKWIFSVITMPPLTQTLGPWIKPTNLKYAKQLSWEKDIMEQLIEQLPPVDYFSQNWSYSQKNWLPFFWRGFEQKGRCTYVLPVLGNADLLWDGLQENIRTDIRKAQNRYNLKVRDDLKIDDFLVLNQMTFARQNKKQPYSSQFIKALDKACGDRKCKKIWIAEDKQGKKHAGVYIIWDENSAYYLLGGGDPILRNSGATSLCLWVALQHAAEVTKKFDFEGSMIESVERFFRGFGAQQCYYSTVSKIPSKILRLREAYLNISKKITIP